MQVFSQLWWLLILLLVISCSDTTAPEMKAMDTVLASDVTMIKVDGVPNAWMYAHRTRPSGGVCDPGTVDPADIPAIHFCMTKFLTSLGVSGVTISVCAAQAKLGTSVTAVLGRWGGCTLGVVKTMEAWDVWLDATQVKSWADWTTDYFVYRMREAAFARMYAEQKAAGQENNGS